MSFIDDLIPYGLKMSGQNLRDAIVFKMNEPFELARGLSNSLKVEEEQRFVLPQLLPFNNMVIEFSDNFCVWACLHKKRENEDLVLCITWMFGELTRLYSNRDYTNMRCICIDLKGFEAISVWGLKEDGEQISLSDSEKKMLGDLWSILRRFLTILSCKNIKTEKEYPPEKLQKKRAKKKRPPLLSFYTLRLGPTSAGGGSGHGGWTNRIHFVRGHMREYTDDRPLFGKISGKFWIAPHARGNKKLGIIYKDYEIDHAEELKP